MNAVTVDTAIFDIDMTYNEYACKWIHPTWPSSAYCTRRRMKFDASSWGFGIGAGALNGIRRSALCTAA